MRKRAQLTIFIIAAILVLILGGVIAYFQYNKNKEQIEIQQPADLKQVSSFISQCVKETAKTGLIKLGQQGRLYPDVYMESSNTKIAYYYYKGQGHFPTKITVVEEELSRYIKENINSCINDFSAFGYDFDSDFSAFQASTEFNENDVTIQVNYPLEVSLDDKKTTLSSYHAKIKLKYLPIYELTKQIYQNIKNEPGWLDISFLSEQPYDIRIIKVSDDTLVYELTDTIFGIEDQPYTFRFGIKYKL